MREAYLNSSTFTQIEELGELFNIPVASESQQVWFIRTSGGNFYDDYRFNNYVAIGWDKIPAEWIIKKPLFYKADDHSNDEKIPLLPLSEKEFKRRVSDLYPDETRPGLVYGQMNSFYNVMRVGDWIVIPSKSTQDLTIGILGDILNEEIKERQVVPNNDYANCGYTHKRSVVWQREIPASYDVYLQRSLRAQQTISNITDISGLVFRHLYPVYVVNNEVRVTFQKTTDGELNALSNIELIGSVIGIADQIASLYKVEPFNKDFAMKTAVGSPGIIELIIPIVKSPAPIVLAAILLRILFGKYDSEKGISTGLCNIFNGVNKLLNDRKERQLKDAEIKLKDAEIQLKIAELGKTQAETGKINAETGKINAETELLKKQAQEVGLKVNRDGQMMIDTNPQLRLMDLTEPSEAEVAGCIKPITENCLRCAEAAKANGIRTGQR